MDVERDERRLYGALQKELENHCRLTAKALDWLHTHMHPYFFITMKDEVGAIVNLASGLRSLTRDRRIVLADRDKELILGCMNVPGSFYDSLLTLKGREISYSEMTHSLAPIPGAEQELEIQRFEFGRKSPSDIQQAGTSGIPPRTVKSVGRALRALYPGYDFGGLRKGLDLLWLNNEHYVRISPPERVARILWLYQQGSRSGGLFFDVENTEDVVHHRESRILFAVGNPPDPDFLAQAIEVFHRLQIGVRRAYSLTISTEFHPYFLGTFYVTTRRDELVQKDSVLFRRLKAELYNTQILPTSGLVYREFVANGVMDGEQASFTNALISFCHTNLSHNRPDRFDLGETRRAFHANPDIALQLFRLFQTRFDPDLVDREAAYAAALVETEGVVDGYNTGLRHLDEVRRAIFRTGLLFVRATLKTNFYVPEKHALAFRLDPSYLRELDPEFIADLPPSLPFRVTFFYSRHGAGYHVGFSDIARGGWRTILCSTADDYMANASTLFREAFVLAHTQHLKNKDIYEGGSKLVVVLDASDLEGGELVTQRLYKLQYGFINAFLDLFITRSGKASHPRVVDYYGEDEPIELGPDENMHDAMIELIAELSEQRKYVLGKGIISSKDVGINHKHYGVTSLGVITFAEIVLAELGIDIRKDPFSVKITGGTNGDVAGNSMRILLERCPAVAIRLIVAGSGVAYDPVGLDRDELRRLVLRADVVEFNPERLHPGGVLLFHRERRQEGLKELYRRLTRTEGGVVEEWVTSDEFHREFEGLLFSVPADLFIPAGGRPETIDGTNWQRLLGPGGTDGCRAIIEGANSFLTPEAREQLQKQGVVVIRDASANKCGVISSSYEIIANLLLSDEEFLSRKEDYVGDVLKILVRRAQEEARVILGRQRESRGHLLYTQISDALSTEINDHYARLFGFFSSRPELARHPLFRRVLLAHLPALIREEPRFRRRVGKLPAKYQAAILAAEIATTIAYRGGWEQDLETTLRGYASRMF